MNDPKVNTNWDQATWEGSRTEKLKRWRALPLKTKLDALDDLLSFGSKMLKARQAKGLPYTTDPPAVSTPAVSEPPTKYNSPDAEQSYKRSDT